VGMGFGDWVEEYGFGGALAITVITVVLYVVHLWLGFSRVAD